ncbi:serine/threonine-protein kinase pats1 [Mizuhopecten yessoensis]|uniref:Serine/threonine-protein kinase pats1 n=1 Tax=Mizuhopecten yessoensis TaxID=6573 RepID=A0A210Q129_MIZYE|nr:serine/threonine-protein kinase pats1 [Mizuhopecten yessoensis]
MQHAGKCLDARLIQLLQSIGSENTGADPNTEGDKSAQTASNSDEFDNDGQQNAGHARPIQPLDSTASKNTGADHVDLQNLGPSTPANSNEAVLKTLRNLIKVPLADRDYTKLGELCVWDFAGHFVFYTTHHTFLTHRAVYLLVTRLDQNINDTVNNDQCFIDATGCKEMKIKDFVSYWMNSVHLYSGAAEHLPPVILVGTHLDKVEGDIEKKTNTYFEDLRRYLLDMESPTSSHLIDTDYTVSNPPDELEIGNLRQKIVDLASKQAYWGEKIPAKWITLEKALMEKKIEGVNIMSYDNVVELDKSTGVPIDDQEKIDLFLRFQHAKGNMIYFNEDCLRNYIVLNPQWLIDAFKCIITAQQFCTKNPALVKHWKALDKTGKLYLGMVDEIFRREEKFCRHKKHILGLMERLHIISHHVVDKDDDKSNTSEEFYFVPSLLKDKVTECEIENYVKGTNGTPYLCYVFENNFLPTAVFHRLIAACLSEYTVAKQESKFLIFCGCGIFDLNGGLTRLVVAFYDSVIQIGLFRLSEGGFAPETSTCLSVRQFVTETLERVLGRYDMNLPFTLNLKCEKSHHLSHEGLLSVDDVITGGKEVACHGHEKDNHTITRHSLLHLWFPAQVSATDPNQGEVDGGPPMTNVAGACARTHQMAVTGTTLGRDQETYLCDSVGKTCVFNPTTGSQTVGHLRQPNGQI